MANAGFFERLGNLWSGFISLWVSDVEKKHPEIAYENAITALIEKYAKLKEATAAIIRRREDTEERLKREQAELAQVAADLETAVDTGQDDLALVLIEKKNAQELEIASLTTELETAEHDAQDAKTSLMSVKDEIGKLKVEKDRMLAKMKSAEARLRIQEQVEGLSVDAEVKALDNVREHIKNTIAEANLGAEMQDADLDNRLQALRQQTGNASARAQLEAMKQARAQAASKKSM
ncbi:MAG: PspA/IM30 family protein [Deltaproteobacteria bacterium]|nr:PspA/IM30 family protein [bacterium]MCB9479367.1 PspA/IM30 family protein [Deltaproteobacteria bacterium]MCB9488951.1 PspA/IM30 family protein [Deltaproteobacteria bacterium]